MPEFLIENFKYGLDSRKSELTSVAGTLEVAVNAHITQGGEFEKRKAFVRTTLPLNSFGLVVTDSGLTIFGSVAQGSLVPALPAGVTYQRLQHPDGATAMSAIVHGKSFTGKAFVVALFADGNQYPYYDGTLVSDFTAGLILTSLNTNTKIANALIALVNTTSAYTAATTAGANVFDIFGQFGVDYVDNETKTSALGTITAIKQADPVPPIAALTAVGSFRILGGSAHASNKFTAVKVNGVNIISANVLWVTSNAGTATAVAARITADTGTNGGYTAVASDDIVYISAGTSGTTPNGYVVETTVTCNTAGSQAIMVGACYLTFTYAAPTFSLTNISADGVDILPAASFTYAGLNTGTGPDSPYASLSAFVTAIAKNINSTSGTHGYCALAKDSTLQLSKLVTSSTNVDTNIFTVLSGTAVPGNGISATTTPPVTVPATMLLTVAPTSQTIAGVSGGGTKYTSALSSAFSATPSGGSPPYTYSWAFKSVRFVQPGYGSASNLSGSPVSSTSRTTSFIVMQYTYLNNPIRAIYTFTCTVSDSRGVFITKEITITA